MSKSTREITLRSGPEKSSATVLVVLLSCLFVDLSVGAEPAKGNLVVLGGTVYTATGAVIQDGVVVIEEGLITAVGSRADTPLPEGVAQLDARGQVIIPGLVDLWSEPPEGNSTGGQSDSRALDLVGRFPRSWQRALGEGVTTLAIAPAPSSGMSGVGAVFKLRDPETVSPTSGLYRSDSHLVLALGMVARSFSAPRITTDQRLGQYYALRKRFTAARTYEKSWSRYWEAVEKYNEEVQQQLAARSDPSEEPLVIEIIEKDLATLEEDGQGEELGQGPETEEPDEKEPEKKNPEGGEKDAGAKAAEPKKEEKKLTPPKKPRVSVGNEILLRTMEGKLPVLVVAHQKGDIGYALRLGKEFGLDVTVVGGTEAYRVSRELEESGVTVAVGPPLLTRWSLDHLNHREENAAELAACGVSVALCGQGGAAFPAHALRLEACVAVRGGLSPDLALRSICSVPAEILGLGDRVGTLEPGKDGDLVILNGEPHNALSRVLRVVVEGRVVIDREVVQ